MEINEITKMENQVEGYYETSKSFHEVLNNELLLEMILENLNMRELRQSSRTCKEWNALAKKIECRRRCFHHFFYTYTKKPSYRYHAKTMEDCFQPNPYYVGKDFENLKDYLRETMKKEFWSRPKFGFLFHGNFYPNHKLVQSLLEFDVYRKYLPYDCKLISINSNAGLVGSPKDYPLPLEIQSNFTSLAGISYTFTPDLSSKSQFSIVTFDEHQSLIHFYPEHCKDEKVVKCILVFSSSSSDCDGQYKIYGNIDKLIRRYQGKLAVGGVVVDDIAIHTFDKKPGRFWNKLKTREMLGVAFVGSSIKAASAIVTTETEKETEDKLEQFKKSLDFDPDDSAHENLGFLFVCSARGSARYQRKNVEGSLFRKIFPKVRLTGCFGHGEYGIDYWPLNYEKNTPEENMEKLESFDGYWHFYTTILVLIQIS